MGIKKIKGLFIAVTAVTVALFGVTGRAEAYTTQNVLGSSKTALRQVSVSTTGRYIAFMSASTNLVSPDTNNKTDAFIKDTETGIVSLLSVTPSGNSGNGNTESKVMITGNGRFALFNSESTDLSSTSGGASAKNLYLRDLKLSTTYLIASGSWNNTNNYPIGLSEDGRFIYYNSSSYSNGDRLYVRDRVLSTTQRVDVDSSGTPAGFDGANDYDRKMVSCDGRFVVLTSGSTNLVAGDTNGYGDIFLADRMSGQSFKNITINANGHSSQPRISCDGNYILFWSNASNLVSSDTNAAADLFRYSVGDETIERVSVNDNETEYSGAPSSTNGGFLTGGLYDMSMDGRYIFYIHATRTPGASLNENHLTMRDTKLGTTTVIAVYGSNYYPWNPVVSYDGGRVYYVAGDNMSNIFGSLYEVTGHL